MQRPGQRAAFLAVGLSLTLLYWGFTGSEYASEVLAQSLTPQRVALAARMQPMNAAFQHLLGRIAFYGSQDFPSALEHYRHATRLNRYSARYWLDLANTEQIMSLPADSRRSLDNALAADPTNPQVANEAANYYLVLGDTATALKLLALTIRYSPGDSRNAVELSWRATQDAHAVMTEVLPQTPEAYMLLIQILMERQQTEAAGQVWQGLMSLKQVVAPETAFPYIEYLLKQGEVAGAWSAWGQFMRREESTRGYLVSGNLVTNGGFEEDILNGGFDWRYRSDPRVALAIDEREAYRGRRSLSITFNGDAVQDAGIYQFIPVEPGTEYRISARVRTEGIEGAGGPQIGIFDAYSSVPLFLSDPLTGTNNWQPVEGAFRSAADSKLAVVRVVRVPGSTRIRGRIWIDELSVVGK